MKKKKKGSIFDVFAILIAFVSLFLNILLLYNIQNTSEPEITSLDYKEKYSKKELGEYFKNYQNKNDLAFPDNIVVWEVDSMTYRGFFRGTEKKLYYITEKYTCVTGDSCVVASGVEAYHGSDDYDYIVTFVVSIDFNDPYDLKFDILDYSIENSTSFVQDEIYDLE